MSNVAVLSWIADSSAVCVDYYKHLEAEYLFNHVYSHPSSSGGYKSTAVQEIQAARKTIEETLKSPCAAKADAGHYAVEELVMKIDKLEKHNAKMEKEISDLRTLVHKLEQLVVSGGKVDKTPVAKEAPAKAAAEEDDEIDLFGSDEEDDAEKEKIKAERLKAYEAKKQKKPAIVAKSSVILDVKPWDDETDMKAMESNVRTIEMEGLIWGASKLVPLAYGIKKLQIMCVVEDEKVSIDELQEKIEGFEDFVQSVDIAAFNKI